MSRYRVEFPRQLVPAILIKRYKRFLADVELMTGEQITVHCPNTGSMLNCAQSGRKVWLSLSDNPKRKYAYTWELIEIGPGQLTCIHSALANKIVKEGVEQGKVAELAGYDSLKTEVRYGNENSRVDILLSQDNERCYVEVKCVTLHEGGGLGLFPDAVSARGARHLRELATVKDKNTRAVLFYCIQNNAVDRVAPAVKIDPTYSRTLLDVMASGVEVLAYRAVVSTEGIVLGERLSFLAKNG